MRELVPELTWQEFELYGEVMDGEPPESKDFWKENMRRKAFAMVAEYRPERVIVRWEFVEGHDPVFRCTRITVRGLTIEVDDIGYLVKELAKTRQLYAGAQRSLLLPS